MSPDTRQGGPSKDRPNVAPTDTSFTCTPTVAPVYADRAEETHFREWQRSMGRRGHPDPHKPPTIHCSAKGTDAAFDLLSELGLVNAKTRAILREAVAS